MNRPSKSPSTDTDPTWPVADGALTEPMRQPPLAGRDLDVTERLPLPTLARDNVDRRDPVEPDVTEPQALHSSTSSEAPPLSPDVLDEQQGEPRFVVSVREHDTEQIPLPNGDYMDLETRATIEHPAEAAWRARHPGTVAAMPPETDGQDATDEFFRYRDRIRRALKSGPEAEQAEAEWQAMVAAGTAGPAFPCLPGETEEDKWRRVLEDFERGCALERQKERVGPPIVAAVTDGQPAAIYAATAAPVPSPNRAAHPVGARAEDKGRVLFDHTWKLLPSPKPAPNTVHSTPNPIESDAEHLDETTERRRAPTLRMPGAPVDPRRHRPTERIRRTLATPSASPVVVTTPRALRLFLAAILAVVTTITLATLAILHRRDRPQPSTAPIPTFPVASPFMAPVLATPLAQSATPSAPAPLLPPTPTATDAASHIASPPPPPIAHSSSRPPLLPRIRPTSSSSNGTTTKPSSIDEDKP
jgi:hypothetical protein